MRMRRCAAAVLFLVAASALADEGMWPLDSVPVKAIQKQHGFAPTAEWLKHVQLSAVRFGGASASFASADGLVFTNHHVGRGAIQKLSSAQRDLMKTGFYAATREQELRCHDLELNVLVEIEDVTDRINAAVKSGMSPAEAFEARRSAMSTVEKESHDRTGLRSDVVTLYHGALYHLYRYKKYTDVRLVFAPEHEVAFFGGDVDNFEYPRYCLDVSFFRVYENDKPIKSEHYLRWSRSGCQEGELVFVAGHPGRTERLLTAAHLEFIRDRTTVEGLNRLRRKEVALRTFAERSKENARRAAGDIFGVQNSRKALLGRLAALQGPGLLAEKRRREETLRAAVAKDARLRGECASAWDAVAGAVREWARLYDELEILEHAAGFNCRQFGIARDLVRLADETAKPNDRRLREYRESNLDSHKRHLFSEAPIYKDLETVKLADGLSLLAETFGADHELVRRALAGKSPPQRAAELIHGTKMEDAAGRRRLADGGKDAIAKSDDPMIALARLVDEPSRAVRTRYEEQVDEPLRQAYAKIARAQFAIHGTDVYPDATGTLRLAYGTTQGYQEQGRAIPHCTELGGVFDRCAEHENQWPFRLPDSWPARRDKLRSAAAFNFVSTADITGGNSGSPVVNRKGECVGIIFDGNLQALGWSYQFDSRQGRSVSVHVQAILEALRTVYGAKALVKEIVAGSRQSAP
ncbi:MAG: Peptidase S46 [Planctomycetes bacterium ADurb.Bin126]|nr:MAG: Peptidase S46 [Planctomycetes bacterium ADurb.Bin126]HOD80159.1 S46 family peptidase [Phycisphaerae bacterium]